MNPKSIVTISVFAATMALSSLVPVIAADKTDKEGVPVAQIDGWAVRVNKELKGCYLNTFFPMLETTLRFGLNMKSHSGYLLIGNTDWKSLNPSKPYRITVELYAGTEVTHSFYTDASVVVSGDTKFLSIDDITDTKFLGDFSNSNVIKIIYDREVITELPLNNADGAIVGLLDCQQKENMRRDPFQSKD